MTFDPPPKGMMPQISVTIDGKYLGPDSARRNSELVIQALLCF